MALADSLPSNPYSCFRTAALTPPPASSAEDAAAVAILQVFPSRNLLESWVDWEARSWASAAVDVVKAEMT